MNFTKINKDLNKLGIDFQVKSKNDLLEVQFLFSERFNIHIQTESDFYSTGVNYLFQILIFDIDDSSLISKLSSYQYGDNGEFDNIYKSLFAAIEKSIEIILENKKYFHI